MGDKTRGELAFVKRCLASARVFTFRDRYWSSHSVFATVIGLFSRPLSVFFRDHYRSSHSVFATVIGLRKFVEDPRPKG